MVKTIEWTGEGVVMIDQTRLPREVVFVTCRDYREVAEAIRGMVIRGAPAIGVAAAMGVALAVKQAPGRTAADLQPALEGAAECLAATRPTAVNLFWAIERVLAAARKAPLDASAISAAVVNEAVAIQQEDIAACHRIGELGASLLPEKCRALTHCNAGGLATAGYGTALGVIVSAHRAGKELFVIVDETRPLLQGARLTAWELQQHGIPHAIICDSAAGHFMRRNMIDAVIVGADRIAANGDTANKVGTYSVAVLAKEHNVPFYVAAPVSTVDLSLTDGTQIPIEERSAREVICIRDQPVAPPGSEALNPAFDVTPARFISAIITERGIARPPIGRSLKALCRPSEGQARFVE